MFLIIQFKTNQNILKILSCIENANINSQWKFHVCVLELHQKQKSIFSKTNFT